MRPRRSSNVPSEAAASPLPKELTTPPVTKMYFIVRAKFMVPGEIGKGRHFQRRGDGSAAALRRQRGAQMVFPSALAQGGFGPSDVFQGVNAYRPMRGCRIDMNDGALLESAELLEPFETLQAGVGFQQTRTGGKKIVTICRRSRCARAVGRPRWPKASIARLNGMRLREK